MNVQINHYLSFNGNCEEALEFYRAALGGDVQVMRYRNSPMASHTRPEDLDRVMHARLVGDGFVLMASDIPSERYMKPNPMTQLSVTTRSAEDADALFAALSAGGTVHMPIQKTFWAERFGMFADKYGFSWMINHEGPR